MEESRRDILESIKLIRNEISGLKKKLEDVNSKKEEWFKKKEDLKKEINKLIKEAKDKKNKKTISGNEISKLKKERDFYNKKVKECIEKLRELRKEKGSMSSKLKLGKNPESVKNQMEKLETSIETDALSYSKEKQVMKKINDLKKIYLESGKIIKINKEIKDLIDNLEDSKNKANEFHDKLIKSSNETKKGFNEFIELSKKINNLKSEQEKAFKEFVKYKKEFSTVNDMLKNVLMSLGAKQKIWSSIKEKRQIKKEEIKKDKIDKRTKEVEAKLKDKKKLTTEDLVLLQED